MYNLTKLKILVIGPQACGKTTVVNYLAEKQNVLENPYRPTAGVRIVEHETEIDNRMVSIEFWDISGTYVSYGRKYQKLKDLASHSKISPRNHDHLQWR